MTIIAIVTAGYMRWVLTCRRGAVVARTASSQYLRMVNDIGRRKYVCVVTILTNVGCLYVCRTLAGGFNSVVAARTIIDDTEVIEVCWPPADRRVAVVAGIAAGNMRRMLARRDDAVMAAAAGTDNLHVINRKDRREYIGVVAVLANIASENMCLVLANGVDAVMAINTLTSDVQMVEIGWQPSYR